MRSLLVTVFIALTTLSTLADWWVPGAVARVGKDTQVQVDGSTKTLSAGLYLPVRIGVGEKLLVRLPHDKEWAEAPKEAFRTVRYDFVTSFQTRYAMEFNGSELPAEEYIAALCWDWPPGPDVRSLPSSREVQFMTKSGVQGTMSGHRTLKFPGFPKEVSVGELPGWSSLGSELGRWAVIDDPDGFVNVRETPDGKIVARLEKDECFAVRSDSSDWWSVVTPKGVCGYVHRSRVALKDGVKGIPVRNWCSREVEIGYVCLMTGVEDKKATLISPQGQRITDERDAYSPLIGWAGWR
jgi:uncharacterized protein YndB with AHSA1/START domain